MLSRIVGTIITLTTDFGRNDPFAGIMKGVILGINPNAHVVDSSHDITPYNIIEASHIISMSYKFFPPTTIHMLVNYYSESGQSNLSAILNSSGLLELFIYQGSASDRFGIKTGDKVKVIVI